MNKKAYMNLVDNWVDYVALIFLLFGAAMTFIAGSKVLSILIVLISSMVVGRIIYTKKTGHKMRLWYMILAFLVGLIVGTRFLTYKAVIVTFIIGAVLGYYTKKHHYLD
jgi:uncharacterized membrane protein